jgi:hypothetical protein
LSGSQNPPQSQDAQFTGKELSASMKNRFLIIEYPSILKSVGATMWLMDSENGHHERFLDDFKERYERMTSQKLDRNDLENDWLSIYSYTTDSRRTSKHIIHSALEYGDFLIEAFAGDLKGSYKVEQEMISGWKKALTKFGKDISSNFEMTGSISDTVEVQTLNSTVDCFGKPLTERDDAHIKKLSDMFATVKAMKSAYKKGNATPKTLDSYLNTPAYITVDDVAAATTLLARNKMAKDREDETKDPLHTVNACLGDYTSTVNTLAQKISARMMSDYNIDVPVAKFDAENVNIGMKNLIYVNSLEYVKDAKEIAKRINTFCGDLKSTLRGAAKSSELKKMMVARTLGDMATTVGFVMKHEDDINTYLSQRDPSEGMKELRKHIYTLFEQDLQNPTFSDAYRHRLMRVLK